jgi:hypothetical protein
VDSPHSSVPPGLADALADRYRIERELGAGGMATVRQERIAAHAGIGQESTVGLQDCFVGADGPSSQ